MVSIAERRVKDLPQNQIFVAATALVSDPTAGHNTQMDACLRATFVRAI